METINYDELYNVVVEWNDGASDILPLGGEYIGEDGNPYGFTYLADAIKYRDAFLETSRKDTDSDAVRVSIIVGERVYR